MRKSWFLWIEALRLPTLPLGWSGIVLGSALARAHQGAIDLYVMSGALLTATLLQVVSNLANDLGDLRHGADQPHRTGPRRALARGLLTERAMKRALFLLTGTAFVAGNLLLLRVFAWGKPALQSHWLWAGFLGLGIASIAAALRYTYAKKRPYGYRGWGDLAVFVFFGYVAVVGTYFLHTRQLNTLVCVAAAGIGAGAVMVLNLNNIRDMDADRRANKRSLALRLGPICATYYHYVLGALCLAAFFAVRLAQEALPWRVQDIPFALCAIGFGCVAFGRLNRAKPNALTQKLRLISLTLFAMTLSLAGRLGGA